MWVATVDFMKAFDSISHSSLWNTLEQCGTESQYVSLFKRLYAQQKATVLTDKESDVFETKRRTKQGDLLSSLLFNTVLQVALKDDLARWQKRGMGICFGDSESDCLTNLRFADDVLLFFTSLEQLQRMMCDFKRSTEWVGLKIHLERTKILSNQNSNRRREVAINNIKVEVLPVHGCAKYLGKKLQQQETTEIRSRIRAAWASYYRYKKELTSKSQLLQNRLRLFNMAISPTLTYASGTWTLTKEHERMIRSTQRKMLRLVVQTKRKYKKKTQSSKEEMKKDNKQRTRRVKTEKKEKATEAPKMKL